MNDGYALEKKFEARLNHLERKRRRYFLQGVYKQVVTSRKGKHTNGEYRRTLMYFHEWQQERFASKLADALFNEGMYNHVGRILKQYNRRWTAYAMEHTLPALASQIPDWKSRVGFHLMNEGIQITIGRWNSGAASRASIILREGSSGGQSGLYEILPYSHGRKLSDIDKIDDVIGRLTLEEALMLGVTATHGTKENFDRTLEYVLRKWEDDEDENNECETTVESTST